jgi:hypothetical protein
VDSYSVLEEPVSSVLKVEVSFAGNREGGTGVFGGPMGTMSP